MCDNVWYTALVCWFASCVCVCVPPQMLSTTKKPEMTVIGGALRGLDAYLVNFTQSLSEGSEFAKDIYKFTRMAVDKNVHQSRYEVPRGWYLHTFAPQTTCYCDRVGPPLD